MSTFPTPDTSHLTNDDYEFIYEPAEDTFLLLDALEAEAQKIIELKPLICVEIGSGSGCVTSFLSKLTRSEPFLITTDINLKACMATKGTSFHNKNQKIDSICTDLVSCLEDRLEGMVDILLFNPPYVVTPSSEINKQNCLSLSWAGGKDGREVIDRVLPLVNKLLSSKGLFYLVVVDDNKPDEINEIMYKNGFCVETILKRKTGPEKLSILKFFK